MHSEPPPEAWKPVVPPAPRKPSLEALLLQTWQGAVFTRLGRTPPASDQARAGAAQVAGWLRDNVRGGEEPLVVFQAALKQYLAEPSESLAKNAFPLSWLTDRMTGYTAKKPVKPPAKTNPYHYFGSRQMVQDPDCPVLMISVEERDAKLARRAAEAQVAHA